MTAKKSKFLSLLGRRRTVEQTKGLVKIVKKSWTLRHNTQSKRRSTTNGRYEIVLQQLLGNWSEKMVEKSIVKRLNAKGWKIEMLKKECWEMELLKIEQLKAGMSNSNPCTGLTMTFKDWKTVCGPHFGNISNLFLFSSLSIPKFFRFKHFDGLKDSRGSHLRSNGATCGPRASSLTCLV